MSDAALAERLLKLFAGSERAHGTHGEPDPPLNGKYGIKKTAKTLEGAATVELWEQHLAGTRPLGVIPIRGDGTCSWGSIDVDQYDADLLPLIRRVEEIKLPLVPCRSKSGGLHLFLLLRAAVPCGEVIAALRGAARIS